MLKERQSARSRSLLKATVRFYNRNLTFDCIVRNISPTGARLDVDAAYVLPNEFELDIPQRSAVYPCELMWRHESAAGVRFKQNVDPGVSHYSEMAKARINALERENSALRLEITRLTQLLQSTDR